MLDALTDLKRALPRGKRLLGLDLGRKTIGLAISDSRSDHRLAAGDPPARQVYRR